MSQAIPATTKSGTPVLILKEGSSETKGKESQRNNLFAAKLIAEIVRSSLGPRGMDKMLVDGLGDVTITNDGATILKEIDVQHPAAKMIVEISKTTDNEVGDGTTSAAILAGSLLENAEQLINREVHPTIIVDGYRNASEKALEFLDKLAIQVPPTDKKWLQKIARTSMASKLINTDSDHLSQIAADALLSVMEQDNKDPEKYRADLDNVQVEKKPGGSTSDTQLIKGIVLDKEVVHSMMPKRIEGAKIALINSPLEIEKTEFSAEIRINDPTQMKKFLDEENVMLKAMVDKLADTGTNVLICQKGIDDIAQHFLAKKGILTVRRAKESDMTKLAKATGGRIVTNLDDLTEKDLGNANLVEERKVETDKWVFVEGCKNPKAVSLLIRGGSQRVVDEADRSMHDALMVVKDVIEHPSIVVGGGAPEAELSYKLKDWAKTLSGREQLAVQKYADALESIPLTLATNSGMDPIDTQVELRAKHGQGKKWFGVNCMQSKCGDMEAEQVYEPEAVKEQIIKASTEVACMILRIDDVIASGKSKSPPGPPGGPGGGMD
ncbi:MAG: TCP-1/cpn60 chaperonin family protein [Nitrososphaerota archaeon]|nr:TCP-1/cpn60 chaperonin family protein [Nitrososphaerota archaeon]